MADLVERLRAHRQEFGVHHDLREVDVCMEAANEIISLRSALSQEREAREKAERERDEALADIERMTPKFVAYEYLESPERADRAEASLAEAKRLLKPFADAAHCLEPDIPDLKDTRGWTFQAIDFRAAARFLSQEPNHER